MVQARLAASVLRAAWPEHDFLLQPLLTHGDRAASGPLTEMSQEGVFVKDLERALLEGSADIAVHSAKDLPTSNTPGLGIAAYLPREDARDILVGRGAVTVQSLPVGARVGTGSPRRASQLLALRPDLDVRAVRGNVDTRLRKLREGEFDALVLAVAGLRRLGRDDIEGQVLQLDTMLPAPGQGALAIQAMAGSEAMAIAGRVDDLRTRRAVEAERAVLSGLGGGCLSAIGVHGAVEQTALELQAVIVSQDGTRVVRAAARGEGDDAVVREVIARLLAGGGAAVLEGRARAGGLDGLKVMVTRAIEQSGNFVRALQDSGAQVVMCPVISIEPLPVSLEPLRRMDSFDWVVFTSVNGVERFFALLQEAGVSEFGPVRVAAIGAETAARLSGFGRQPDLVPSRFVAEDLAEAFSGVGLRGRRVLLPRAAGARDVLPERLRAQGAEVQVLEIYRAVPPPNLEARLRQALRNGVDVVTFTSSSTVRHFVSALKGETLAGAVRVACIGPITADTARERGLRVDIIATEYTARGLLEAIVRHHLSSATP